jgi:hypothetical protein
LIGQVWVGPRTGLSACKGIVGEREPDRYMRGCFRVSQLGTFVPGVAACPFGPVGRCVSSADTSLSLSLSLSCPSSTSRLAADFPRTDRRPGYLSGVGFSLCICGVRRGGWCLFERHRPLPLRVVAFEEAPAFILTRAGSRYGERRGPNPRPRRSQSLRQHALPRRCCSSGVRHAC